MYYYYYYYYYYHENNNDRSDRNKQFATHHCLSTVELDFALTVIAKQLAVDLHSLRQSHHHHYQQRRRLSASASSVDGIQQSLSVDRSLPQLVLPKHCWQLLSSSVNKKPTRFTVNQCTANIFFSKPCNDTDTICQHSPTVNAIPLYSITCSKYIDDVSL